MGGKLLAFFSAKPAELVDGLRAMLKRRIGRGGPGNIE